MFKYPIYWSQDGKQFMRYIEAKNFFDVLVQLSQLYNDGKLSDRDYINNIHGCFVDDNGEDWLDEPENLRWLAESIAGKQSL